uniref:Uncharacterized protein n=1 Tax=Ixodes ricinus TaxID=34613 RepID=A0A6B0U9D6_IXORI
MFRPHKTIETATSLCHFVVKRQRRTERTRNMTIARSFLKSVRRNNERHAHSSCSLLVAPVRIAVLMFNRILNFAILWHSVVVFSHWISECSAEK